MGGEFGGHKYIILWNAECLFMYFFAFRDETWDPYFVGSTKNMNGYTAEN